MEIPAALSGAGGESTSEKIEEIKVDTVDDKTQEKSFVPDTVLERKKGTYREVTAFKLLALKMSASISNLKEIDKFPVISTSFSFEKINIGKAGEPKMKLGCRKYKLINIAYAQFITSGEYRKQINIRLPYTTDEYKIGPGDEIIVHWIDDVKTFKGKEISPTYSSGEFIYVRLESSIGKKAPREKESDDIESTKLYGIVLTDCIRATFKYGDYIVFGILNIASVVPKYEED